MIETVTLQERILEQLDMTKEVDDEELTRIIHQILKYLELFCYEISILSNFIQILETKFKIKLILFHM